MKKYTYKSVKQFYTLSMAFGFMILSYDLAAQKFIGNIHQGSTPPQNFTQYWNQVTPENAGKWGSAEPNRDSYNWGPLDAAYNYADQNGMPVKGHTLIWGNQAPGWIGGLSQSEQRAEIEEWISDYFDRYPGTDMIDVVNEPLHAPPNQYLNALGGSGSTGWDWVITAFEIARQYAPPGCLLLINEYGIISNPTEANNYMNIVNLLNDRDLIDGIGIQCHAFNMDNVTTGTMTQVLGILDNAGLPIYVSELDIRGNDQQQLQRYQEKFPIFWNDPDVAGITLWGYIQGTIWQEEAWLVTSGGSRRPAMDWLYNNYINVSNPGGDEHVWLEAECGTVGSLWNVNPDGSASNGNYVTIQSGNNSTGSAPGSSNGRITYNFNVDESGNYTVWGRVITPSPDDDSFWVRMDGGSWTLWNSIPSSSSWQWDDVHDSNSGGSTVTYNLSSGNHTLTVAYREDGAQLDKIYITNSGQSPSGTGSAADNCTAPPSLDLSSTSLSFDENSGNSTITVTSNVSWSVGDNQSWISVSPISGSNNGSFVVSVTSNGSSSSRSGTVTVSGGGLNETVSVVQSGTGGTGSGTITVRARGNTGSESIQLRINDVTVQTWSVSTSYQTFNYNVSQSSANVKVYFDDSGGGSNDVQVDYIQSDGTTYQAEDQETNTGVWQDQCGGSFSEWIHCPGYIDFGTVSFGGGGSNEVWLEAECGNVGSLWNVVSNGSASNGQYVTIQLGNNSTGSAPGSSSGHITFSFSVSESGNYDLWARVIAPSPSDDSFWVQMDGGTWTNWNNIAPGSTSWTWDEVTTYNLGAGAHTLTIAYREDGTQLDKVYLTGEGNTPSGSGSAATNCGGARTASEQVQAIRDIHQPKSELSYKLDQNYPNPFNGLTTIGFSIPEKSMVNIKVYNLSGRHVATVLNAEVKAGIHSIDFRAYNLESGIYLYRIQTDQFVSTRKMMVK